MTVANIAVTPLSDLDRRTQLRRAVIASTVGTTSDEARDHPNRQRLRSD
jgi:hypothetical protein